MRRPRPGEPWPPPGHTAWTLPATTMEEEDRIRAEGDHLRNAHRTRNPVDEANERLNRPRLVRKPDGNVVRVRGPLKPGYVELEPARERADSWGRVRPEREVDSETVAAASRGRLPRWPSDRRVLSRDTGLSVEENLTLAMTPTEDDEPR